MEIFNTGSETLNYSIKVKDDWIKLSSTQGAIQYEEKIYVSVDWQKAPKNQAAGTFIISGAGRDYTLEVSIRPDLPSCAGFIENNGVVSIEAARFDRAIDNNGIQWITLPNMGRTGSAVTMEPANAERQAPGENAPSLEYTFTLFDTGRVKVGAYLSPTLNYKKNEGLKYAIAIDDEEPQIVNMHEGETQPDWEYPQWWNVSVTDHIKIKETAHKISNPGQHTLKIWMVDPGVVFQKFVINAGGLKQSYLGPPESKYIKPAE
ncbi:MAG: hypothetical protein JXB44_09170 [Calditrichaceae bacterium]|nr:hypothetical protein [Calditrichaceae bacterium]